MTKKSLTVIGFIVLFVFLQSCASKPEESVLKRWFHANAMNDKTTMAAMAMEPVKMDVERWDIISVGKDIVEPASLPEMNKAELELKKKVEDSSVITIDAKDAVDEADYELSQARGAAAKRAAQTKKNELQAKYEEIRANHDQIQKDYNMAKAAAAREEEITNFSFGSGQIANIRDLTGDVHSKEVEVKVEGKSGTKNYKFILRRYLLKDETLNLPFRGRWIILKIEPIA